MVDTKNYSQNFKRAGEDNEDARDGWMDEKNTLESFLFTIPTQKIHFDANREVYLQ